MCFGYDEGLPGKAWASRHPIILNDLQNPLFRRRDAARTAELTCGVAIPVFAGDILLAVLVFLCGDDEDHVGAIELWHNDPAHSAEMGMVDGYFGIAESFPVGGAAHTFRSRLRFARRGVAKRHAGNHERPGTCQPLRAARRCTACRHQ